MSLLRAAAAKSCTVAAFEKIVEAPLPAGGLNEIRDQLWRLRIQYWYGRVSQFPGKVTQARAELPGVLSAVGNYSSWTYADVARGSVVATQFAGAFCIGEAFGRWNAIGYTQGQNPDAHH